MNTESQPDREDGRKKVEDAYREFVESGDVGPFYQVFFENALRVEEGDYSNPIERAMAKIVARLTRPVATWIATTGYTIEERIRRRRI